MEDGQNQDLRRKKLEERLEQLHVKVETLIHEERMLNDWDLDFEKKVNKIRCKIRETYDEIYQARAEIHRLSMKLIAFNETLDVYLENGSIEKGYGDFEIFLHGTSTRIGHVRLNEESNMVFGNIGYSLEEKYRGHHFMLQSLELLKDTMLKMKIVKPIITVEPGNIPSIKTIQNFGGVLIRNHQEYDTYYDTYEVDLMKKEEERRK